MKFEILSNRETNHNDVIIAYLEGKPVIYQEEYDNPKEAKETFLGCVTLVPEGSYIDSGGFRWYLSKNRWHRESVENSILPDFEPVKLNSERENLYTRDAKSDKITLFSKTLEKLLR